MRRRARKDRVRRGKPVVPKKQRLESNVLALRQAGIAFREFNKGLHLRLKAGEYTIDYWPSTDKWVVDKDFKNMQRGVDGLIECVRLEEEYAATCPRLDGCGYIPGTMIS